MRRAVIFFLVLSPFLSLISAGERVADGQRKVPERLEYDIYWSVLPVGRMVIETAWQETPGRTWLRTRLTVESNAVLSKLFPVRDIVESLVDPATGLPVQLSKRTREGRHVCHDDLHVDAARGVARWENHRKGSVMEYSVPAEVHDAVSLMVAMRDQPFKPGEERRFPVAVDDKLHEVIVKAGRIEHVDLGPLGFVPCLRMTLATARPGMFVRKVPRALWISLGPPTYAVQMLVKAPIGTVRVALRAMTPPRDLSGQADIDAPAHAVDQEKGLGPEKIILR